jgi:phage terminase Nu1 subunit (DNA packaging protein)
VEIDLNEPTRPQIATVLGISSRWVGELRSRGDLPSDGASLLENIEMWAAGKYGIEGAQGDLDLEAERARLAHEQANAKAMDNAERRKELASLPDMSGAVVSVIALAVSRLQQVGLTVANGDHKLRARIDTAINDALDELSVARVEEARGGGLHEEEDPEDG